MKTLDSQTAVHPDDTIAPIEMLGKRRCSQRPSKSWHCPCFLEFITHGSSGLIALYLESVFSYCGGLRLPSDKCSLKLFQRVIKPITACVAYAPSDVQANTSSEKRASIQFRLSQKQVCPLHSRSYMDDYLDSSLRRVIFDCSIGTNKSELPFR